MLIHPNPKTSKKYEDIQKGAQKAWEEFTTGKIREDPRAKEREEKK